MQRLIKQLTLTFGAAAISAAAAAASGVVATIPPLHSVVQAVMGDTGEATLLLSGQVSAHGVALKPSQARALYNAELVFYIHDEFETFLPETVRESGQAHAVTEFSGVNLLRYRESEEFGHHDHGHGHKDEHHDDHDEYDMHIWFDIDNVKAIARQVARILSARHPEHAETYAKNSSAFQQRLDALDKELAQTLAPVKGVPYVVFHDAYQYAEKRYGLQAPTPLLAQPHLPSSARHLSAVKHAIEENGIGCAFSEPQFSDKAIRAVAADGALRLGVLDPLGAGLPPGEGLYAALMRQFAREVAACLAGQ